MKKATIHVLSTPSGLIHVLQEGNQFSRVIPEEQTGQLSGLFNQGGFFDKVIKTASGVFKKEDGTPTFIGESIKDVASSFGDQLAADLTRNNQNNPFAFNPQLMPGVLPTPGGTTLAEANDNPLPDDKDNTVRNIVLAVVGTAAVGTGIYFATKGK